MPLTDKQVEYLQNCNHRWNIKTGSTGSGKSFLDYAVTIPKRIMACRGEGHIILLGNTQGTLERNILDPMRDLYPGLVGQIRDKNKVSLFGRSAYALGADSKKHIERIQGATVEYAYGDEMTTWEHGVFVMLQSRLRCLHSRCDGTCNPDNPGHWFKTFLDSDADINQQQYSIDDNPYLPVEFVKQLKQEYAGTVYYDRYILGEWKVAQGVIYPMFDECVVDVLPLTFSSYAVSMDYGTQNATAMLLWGLNSGVWYAIKEYYYSGRDTRQPLTDDEYRLALLKLTEGIHCQRLIVDPSAASFITLVKRKDTMHVDPADNDVLDGIRETATALQRGVIKISRNCVNTIREAGGYVWDEASGEDHPVKKDDHGMDAIRYFVKTMKLVREKSLKFV